jgi:hypothetical protein
MSRNFHNVHVYAPTERARDRVIKAVLAFAKREGFERIKSAAGADCVIRLGGRAPWFSIQDDIYGATEIASAVAKATKLSVLEAYCEASAIVSLALFANGRRAGMWAQPGGKPPPGKLAAPLLVQGTPADLAAKWTHGIQQVFPENALAVAAKQLGMRVPQMFGETTLRAVTIALRRKQAAWKPRYQKGAPAFHVGWGSNQGWGGRHMVFEGETDLCHRVHVRSTGGPARGITITFSGSALDDGHLELLSCSHERLHLVRDGNTWRDPDAAIPAGLVEAPDTWQMARREADKARALEGKLEWYLDVSHRALKAGECALLANVATRGGEGAGALDLMVMWKPWRPSVARAGVDDSALFALHRKEHPIAYITLRGSLAEAWAWARPRIEAWAAEHDDRELRVMRNLEVMHRAEAAEGQRVALGPVAPAMPGPTTTFCAQGRTWMFGTASDAPYRMDPREQLAVHLVLFVFNPSTDNAAHLRRFEAICDEAVSEDAACSALVVEQQYRPDPNTTGFEGIAVGDGDPIRIAAWHAQHLRGVDKRIWLSAALVPHLDRAKLPDYAAVTAVGRGLRIQIPDSRTRTELEPLIAALGTLVPTQAEIERWMAARPAQLT